MCSKVQADAKKGDAIELKRNRVLQVATAWQNCWFRPLLPTANKITTGH